jgi:hypothetical protein
MKVRMMKGKDDEGAAADVMETPKSQIVWANTTESHFVSYVVWNTTLDSDLLTIGVHVSDV